MTAKKAKFVVYVHSDEVLIAPLKEEKALLRRWFGKDMGRVKEEYDREEVSENVVQIDIASKVSVANRNF